MRQATNRLETGWQTPSIARGKPALAKIIYRSRATRPLAPADIAELTRTAQARNARESITGVMVLDGGRFYQWIEGPADNLGRVMHSIRHDQRHTDIEILGDEPVEARTFDGWSMKLAMPGPVMTSWRREVIEPPPAMVEDLRRQPHLASALLMSLKPQANAKVESRAEDFGDISMGGHAAAILKSVFLSAVIPVLQGGAGVAPRLTHAHPRVSELAELLVSSDQGAAGELIKELHASGLRLPLLLATVVEPAARRLGDLWSEDFCSELDVTLGLCRLQATARSLAADRNRPGPASQPAVLIAPEPGELHQLGAALDGLMLRHAGWSPSCDYPATDQALQDTVASTWFDVLDLSLSTAFRREHRLDRVSRTIEGARRASCNHDIVVLVGGRVFHEDAAAGREVGADLALSTAMEVERSILNSVDVTRTVALTPSVQSQLLATAS